MSTFIGRQIEFAIATEAVRGTAEATATKAVKKVTCNVIPQVETVIDDSTFGRIEDAETSRTVRKWTEGDVEGILHVDTLGYVINSIYGSTATTDLGDGAFEHENTLAQNILHPTLTLFVKDADVRQEKVAGALVSTLGIEMTTDDYIRYTMSFLGKQSATDSSTFPALTTDYDFISRDVTVKVASSEAGLVGATALKVKTFNIDINTNAEADFVFGNYSPDEIYNKQFVIEGEFETNYTNNDLKTLFESKASRYMSLDITGEADLGGGNHPTVSFLFNKIQITSWERSSDADELSTQTVGFKAFYNVEDEQQSKVTIINVTETY